MLGFFLQKWQLQFLSSFLQVNFCRSLIILQHSSELSLILSFECTTQYWTQFFSWSFSMLCKGTQLLIGPTSVYTCLLIFACYCTSINVVFILFVVFCIPRLFNAKMGSKSLHSKSVLMTSHWTLDLCILPYRTASYFFFSEQFSNLLL